MGGDEIVAEWLGSVYTTRITTTGSVQRLEDVSLRFKSVRVYNATMGGTAAIGKYLSSGFTNFSQVLGYRGNMYFEYVDLYELGCQTDPGSPDTQLRILGINNY